MERSIAPAHFTLEMKNFSVISSSKIGKYGSSEFEVGGYKWRLCIHPNGNKEKNVNDHISLYLSIVHEDNVPMLKFGWEVKATFKLFVYDHIRDNYLTVKDESEEPKCFHRMKTEHGFDNFLSLATLKDPARGYLQQDGCVFGAEVFVQQPNGKGECLLTTSLSANNTYAIKIKYSTILPQECWYSEEFSIGKCNWKLCVYPQGNGAAKGKQISLCLHLANSGSVPAVRKVYAKFKLRMIDQLNNSRSVVGTREWWFMKGHHTVGVRNFMSLENLRSEANGYIVKDFMIVEVEITLLCIHRLLLNV